jgi:hypothetical protein
MGYDIYGGGDAEIKAEHIQACAAAIYPASQGAMIWGKDVSLKKIPENHNELARALVTLTDNLFEFSAEDHGAVHIEGPDGCFRHLDDVEWVFKTIGRCYKWRWCFDPEEGLVVEDSSVVYGQDSYAPNVVHKLVDVIYPPENDRKPISALDGVDHEVVLLQIENIIREGGFGPQAGMNELERLAEV